MRIREPWPVARSRQRQREFGPLFRAVPARGLGDALEIGGGDGFVASLIAGACRTFISSDSYMRKAAVGTETIQRLVCDATRLPFQDASFDFIFSSSVLEHIRDRRATYREMARCLRSGGVMIHVMPSRTWKLLQVLFYYPNLLIGALDFVLDKVSGASSKQGRLKPDQASEKASEPTGEKPGQARWEDKVRLPSWREMLRGILPTVHGEYPGHLSEWRGFGTEAWASEFEAAGFDVRKVIRLPLYSGYAFGLEWLRRVGEARGWSSHNAFVLSRSGEDSPPVHWFTENPLGNAPRRQLPTP
jgi:SAM-dependent methyltransferase